ncbi:MAG TPA: metallophosphoesterase [Microbacteriaceae bacterium]|nr:metallophosphoesterase [Microbacteriaceae bacterium]
MKRSPKALYTLAGFSTAAAVWGFFIERHLRVLRNVSLPLVPVGCKPLRILHLSDLHLAPWQKKKADWISSLARLNPDLVVLTGDLMGHKDSLTILTKALSSMAGVPGVYVHGSNDYYGPILKNPFKYLQEPSRLSTRKPDIDTVSLDDFLTVGLGFKNLNNSAVDVSVDNTKIRFFGLGDPHIRFDDPELVSKRLVTLDNVSDADIRMGVVHAPYRESLDYLLDKESDLIFAGHTHGGQVRVPGIGALTSNSDLPANQARGLSVWHRHDKASFLHVSAGLGTSIFAPVRFFCRPEATMITLTPERS